MKTLIICKSIHQGNTEKIAKKIAKVLNADLIKPEGFNSKDIKKYDIIGLGSGIYGYKHHKSILNIANNSLNLNDKNVFIFSTSGIINKAQHNNLKKILEKKNAKFIGEFFCRGFNKNNNRDNLTTFEYIMIVGLQLIGGINKGRPNEADFKEAEDFAEKIKKVKMNSPSATHI